MLDSDKKTIKGRLSRIPKKAYMWLASIIVVGALVGGAYWFVTTVNAVKEAEMQQTGTGQAAGAAADEDNPTTQFRGDNVNDADPEAIRAYCDDVVNSGRDSAKIRDMCVLNELTRKYIPQLSNSQIEALLDSQPQCLKTGTTDEGVNCFEEFDESGCNVAGFTIKGDVCVPSGAKKEDPLSQLLAPASGDICSIVSGCQAEAEFDENGFNRFGCNREGRREDGTMCPYEYITRIYGEDERDQMGFGRDGFNDKGCDIQGLRADGTRCPIEDITRVYNRKGLDIFGLTEDGFNAKGCGLNGLDRKGNTCSPEDIPRIVDPETGLDQLGLDEDGYNALGCNLSGFKRDGTRCSLEDTPRIFGKNNLDQFGLRKNGRNEFNCDLSGLKPNGQVCSADQITRIINPETGEDQFGYYANGRNSNDCDFYGKRPDGSQCSFDEISRIIGSTGVDQLGLKDDGFNENGCNIAGVKRDGSRCKMSEVTRVFDKDTGLDQFNLDSEGFNAAGCNIDGLNRSGEICDIDDIPLFFDPETGLNQFNLDKDGYNAAGCNLEGKDREGNLCAIEDIPRIYDKNNRDQFSLDKKGFNEKGCSLDGVREDGSLCDYEDVTKIFDAKGINQLGYNKDNRNAAGCDVEGRKEDGTLCTAKELERVYGGDGFNARHYDEDGLNRLKLDAQGYNVYGCDLDGRRADGSICPPEQITRVFNPETGLDQFSLDKDGYNEFGCDLNGMNREGERCAEEDIPRIFSSDMKDQFGNSIADLPDSVWEKEAAKKRLTPLLDKDGNAVYDEDGNPLFIDGNGFVRKANGQVLLDDDGKPYTLKDGSVVNSKGEIPTGELLFDKDGNEVSPRGVQTVRDELPFASMDKAVDERGEQIRINQEPAFVDDNGFLRDKSGNFITDDNGERLVLKDGEIQTASGKRPKGVVLDTVSGGDVEGSVSAQPTPTDLLVDENGNPILIDGKPAYVDRNGNLKRKDGSFIVGDDGEPLSLKNGKVVDGRGEPVSESRMTDVMGNQVRNSGIKKLPVDGKERKSPMLDENGEQMYFKDTPAFVDDYGYIVDDKGNYILDENGERMRLDDGQVVSDSGVVVSKSKFKNALGQQGKGDFSKGKGLTPYELKAKQAAEVLTPSQREALGIDGEGYNEFGCDLNGLRRDGSLCDLDEVTRLFSDGGYVDGMTSSELLTDANGNPILIDGEKAYVDENGNIKRKDGSLVRGEDGQPLSLDGGKIVDSVGEPISASRLTDEDGNLVLNSDLHKLPAKLTDGNGQSLLIDGEEAYVDEDGVIRRLDGSVVTDENGEPLLLKGGKVVNADGELIDPARLTDKNGNKVDNANLKKSYVDGKERKSPLLDSTGEQMFFDDKPAFVDEDGFIVDENGDYLLDANGERMRLNGDDIVTESGANVDSGAFENARGKKSEGGFNKGKALDSKEVAFKQAVESLSKAQRDALGMSDDGRDQFSLDSEGFNRFGCDLYGRDRNGNACPEEYVTRRFDGENFDQFGVNESGVRRSGLDSDGENVFGCRPDDPSCSISMRPRLTDASGVDQFNQRENGKNRLGLDGDGYNEKDCNLEGRSRLGEVCDINDIPRLLDGNGRDQFGLGESGLNEQGCGINGLDANGKPCELVNIPRIFDINGIDQLGLTEDGFNEAGCNLDGINRAGELCDFNDIPRIVGVDGLDQFSLDSQGYNAAGCNVDGFNREGERCALEDIPRIVNPFTGLDQLGFKEDGFNVHGCDIQGRKSDGTLCDFEDMTRIFDPKTNLDQFGFGPDNYNEKGCDFYGYDRDGKLCDTEDMTRVVDAKGVDQFKIGNSGYNDAGCDINGVKRNGERCKPAARVRFISRDGVDENGFDENFVNENGCDINGLNKNGERCDLEDVTQIFDEDTGISQIGLKENGRNEFGCDINGLKEDGTACSPSEITSWFDGNNLDQFSLNQDGFNANECDLYGRKPDGTLCENDEVTRIVGFNGFDQRKLDADGYTEDGLTLSGFNRDGCDKYNLNEEGKPCAKHRELGLDAADGQYIDAKRDYVLAWLGQNQTKLTEIAQGSYDQTIVDKELAELEAKVAEARANSAAAIAAGNAQPGSQPATEVAPNEIKIPIGYMTQVYIKTPVNSDYTQDVYGEISYGELAGATVVGNIVVPYVDDRVMPRDKFYYQFKTLVYNRRAYTIDAVSLSSGGESSMVDADDVDYHRIQRYGGLILGALASAGSATFLDSQAERDLQAQAEIVDSVVASSPTLGQNTRELTKENLKVATNYLSQLGVEQFSRRPTIYEGAGPQLIIFRQEQTDEGLPAVFVGLD